MTKKYMILLLSIMYLFSNRIILNYNNYDLYFLHKLYKKSNYYIYAYDNYDIDKTICGNYYIYNIDNSDVVFKQSFCKEIVFDGVNEKIKNDILSMINFDIIDYDDRYDYMVYGYCRNNINSSVIINNKKINIQIYFNNNTNTLKIGLPLLIGYI